MPRFRVSIVCGGSEDCERRAGPNDKLRWGLLLHLIGSQPLTPVDLPYRPHKGEVEDGVSTRSGMAITLTLLLQFSQEGIGFFCQQFGSLPQEVFVSPHIPFFFERLLTISSTGKRIGNQVTTQILL